MEHRGDQRPPRSARPGQHSSQPAPGARDAHPARSPPAVLDPSKHAVSFQQASDRHSAHRPNPAYHPQMHDVDVEQDPQDPSRVGRKKSLVRPDRERVEPGHRQWHYRSHATGLEEQNHPRVAVQASSAYFRLSVPLGLMMFVSHGQLSVTAPRPFLVSSRRGCSRVRSGTVQAWCNFASSSSAVHRQRSTCPGSKEKDPRMLDRPRAQWSLDGLLHDPHLLRTQCPA